MNKNNRMKLEMKNISIHFPGVQALDDAHLEVESGRIHALIGANGAGKSTLMKVLSGAYNHYTGDIYIDGKEVHIRSPKEAKDLGIDIVYQEVDTALIPYLNVTENIMLDIVVNRMKGKHFMNWKELHRSARKVLERIGITLDTKKMVQELSLAEKQMVLIARAIAEERQFLILDEPTAPLSTKETEELFRIVRDLAYNHNVGIIFISHRLPELFEICEEITIMRDGKVVTSDKINNFDSRQVVELMLGRKLEENYHRQKIERGDKLLEVIGLTEKSGLVKDIDLDLHAKEIIGIAGLVGAGKTELCKTLFGAYPVGSGEMKLNNKKLHLTAPHKAVKHGFALVPEERRKEGVLVEEPVYSNLTAATLSRFTRMFGFLKPRAERVAAKEMIGELGIKTPHENQKVAFLSGGNQQKVAVGKWLMAEAEVYIFDEPTKGVDVGAKRDIFDLIDRLTSMGKGIIYASSELPEILSITDRIYVMYDGQIVKELITKETTEEEILYYSAGGK